MFSGEICVTMSSISAEKLDPLPGFAVLLRALRARIRANRNRNGRGATRPVPRTDTSESLAPISPTEGHLLGETSSKGPAAVEPILRVRLGPMAKQGGVMEITRNQYYLAGLVLLFLGIQFRMIETVEFSPEFTQFMAERTGHPLAAVNAATQSLTQAERPMVKKSVRPPEWVGWALLSFGSVLILHSWAMKRPDGLIRVKLREIDLARVLVPNCAFVNRQRAKAIENRFCPILDYFCASSRERTSCQPKAEGVRPIARAAISGW